MVLELWPKPMLAESSQLNNYNSEGYYSYLIHTVDSLMFHTAPEFELTDKVLHKGQYHKLGMYITNKK